MSGTLDNIVRLGAAVMIAASPALAASPQLPNGVAKDVPAEVVREFVEGGAFMYEKGIISCSNGKERILQIYRSDKSGNKEVLYFSGNGKLIGTYLPQSQKYPPVNIKGYKCHNVVALDRPVA